MPECRPKPEWRFHSSETVCGATARHFRNPELKVPYRHDEAPTIADFLAFQDGGCFIVGMRVPRFVLVDQVALPLFSLVTFVGMYDFSAIRAAYSVTAVSMLPLIIGLPGVVVLPGCMQT